MEPFKYPVRTPTWVKWTVGIVSLGAIAGMASLPAYLRPPPGGSGPLWWCEAMMGGLIVLAFAASRSYWIRAGAIELHADRIVIPGHFAGARSFAVRSLRIYRVRVQQGIQMFGVPTGARLDRGEYITFVDGAQRRKLSERVLVVPGSLPWLLADLEALAHGAPARGVEGWQAVAEAAVAEAAAATPDHYQARLDAELEELDGDRLFARGPLPAARAVVRRSRSENER
jgi:hypothetical protein